MEQDQYSQHRLKCGWIRVFFHRGIGLGSSLSTGADRLTKTVQVYFRFMAELESKRLFNVQTCLIYHFSNIFKWEHYKGTKILYKGLNWPNL